MSVGHIIGLTHSSILNWKPVKGSKTNSADLDQMPHNVVSDQDLHCLLTGFFNKTVQPAFKEAPEG